VCTKMGIMQYCDTSSLRVAVASVLGTLTAFGLNGAVLAAGTCMKAPNLNAGQGVHWYYRFDRINHRKCWYAMETGLETSEDPPLEPTHSPTTPLYLTLFSWFTPLGGGPPGSATAGMQPKANKDVPSATPREALKAVHAARNERSRPAPPTETKNTGTVERDQPSASLSSAEHAEKVKSACPIRRRRMHCFSSFCDGMNCVKA
jgi:hypothetical protein